MNKNSFSLFWKFIKTVMIIGAVLGSVYLYFALVNRFPAPEGPKEITFKWEYKHQNYQLHETYYQSIDQYYAKKTKGIVTGQEEGSISKYLTFPKEDQTISKLTDDLEGLGKSKGLSRDEIADMTLVFVQSIPYDEARAKIDLTHPRYPYEVLYENLGICSDKSLLADALFREEGYGSAVFLFPKEQHMAIGIECPKDLSSYNSGYCFAETTATGNKIGLIPELKDNLQATALEKLPTFSGTSQPSRKLSDPLVMAKSNGFSYEGIVLTIKLANQINSLKAELSLANAQIASDEKELKSLGTSLDGYKSMGDYQTYNAYVPAYNSLLEKVQNEISGYNQKVDTYNKLIAEYY